VVPLDYEPYAERIADFAADTERLWVQRGTGSAAVNAMAPVREAASELRRAASRFNARRQAALDGGTGDGFAELNRQLLSVERAFLDPDGLPGRSWYRHLIYAPKFTYAPEMLPGVTEAVMAGDDRRAQRQAIRLTAALRRAAASLEPAAK
jgi:N-acetylated-alpha-linked acidic dipeptidase